MTRLATATVAHATCATTRATRRLAQLQRADEIVKTLTEQIVDCSNNPPKLCAIKMTLHESDHILYKQIALHLHDRRGVRADEENNEIVTRFSVGGIALLFLIKLSIVKGHLNGRTGLSYFVEIHTHLIERLTKVVVTLNRPAHLKQVLTLLKLDARFVFVKTTRSIFERAGTGIFPQGLECVLQVLKRDVTSQRHLTMHMNF